MTAQHSYQPFLTGRYDREQRAQSIKEEDIFNSLPAPQNPLTECTAESSIIDISEEESKLSPSQRLDRFFSSALPNDGSPSGYTYSDQEITEIRDILRCINDGVWGTTPRLYIVLRRIGLLSFYSDFLSNQITDASFPFCESNLPRTMDRLQRRTFLEIQKSVLTKESATSKCELGEHAHFLDRDQIPFRKIGVLGTGGYAQVDKVSSNITGMHYARKLLDRRIFGRTHGTLLDFENELKILKRLLHQHVVEIIGSYTDPYFAAIIMSPIAECDLCAFLKSVQTSSDSMSLLQTFFGCLATALQYLHKEKIRHKDIKPSNVLIKDGTVLLTDFGLSRDCNNLRSTTEGPTAFTARYCAPEVADFAQRNYSSDMWSLGCIFLEMYTVMQGVALCELSGFFKANGTRTISYWSNPDAVIQWTQNLREMSVQEDIEKVPIWWAEQLLQRDRSLRPSAHAVSFQIATHQSTNGRIGEFCGICCRMEHSMENMNMDMTTADVIPVLSSIESDQSGDFNPSYAREGRLSAAPLENLSSDRRSKSVDPLPLRRSLEDRYFILRAIHEIDIETSNAHSSWVSTPGVMGILNKAYNQKKGKVYLIFSVKRSHKFCGVAEMTGPVDRNNTDEHWVEDKWKGRFAVSWLSTEQINYTDVSHLRTRDSNALSVTQARDGDWIQASSGEELMSRFGLGLGGV